MTTKTKKANDWRQKGEMVRLRVEDTEALRLLGKRRPMGDVLHEVIEAGLASIATDLPAELAKLKADRLLIAAYLRGRSLEALHDLETEGLL